MVRVTLNRDATSLLNDLHVSCEDCKHRRFALSDQTGPRVGAEDPQDWYLGVSNEVPIAQVQA
jgi:hypothetical protein